MWRPTSAMASRMAATRSSPSSVPAAFTACSGRRRRLTASMSAWWAGSAPRRSWTAFGSSSPRIDCPAVSEAHTAKPHHVRSSPPTRPLQALAEVGVRLRDPEVAQDGSWMATTARTPSASSGSVITARSSRARRRERATGSRGPRSSPTACAGSSSPGSSRRHPAAGARPVRAAPRRRRPPGGVDRRQRPAHRHAGAADGRRPFLAPRCRPAQRGRRRRRPWPRHRSAAASGHERRVPRRARRPPGRPGDRRPARPRPRPLGRPRPRPRRHVLVRRHRRAQRPDGRHVGGVVALHRPAATAHRPARGGRRWSCGLLQFGWFVDHAFGLFAAPGTLLQAVWLGAVGAATADRPPVTAVEAPTC